MTALVTLVIDGLLIWGAYKLSGEYPAAILVALLIVWNYLERFTSDKNGIPGFVDFLFNLFLLLILRQISDNPWLMICGAVAILWAAATGRRDR